MYEVRRPLIGVSLVVSAGILWGKYSQPPDAGFLFFMLPIFALAWLCIGKYKSFFIFILLFGLGVLRVISSFQMEKIRYLKIYWIGRCTFEGGS